MKRSLTKTIGDLLNDFVRENEFGNKLKEVQAIECWNEIFGKQMGQYIRSVHLSKGVLVAEITSSVVRAELMMHREELRRQINEKMGETVVTKIVLR